MYVSVIGITVLLITSILYIKHDKIRYRKEQDLQEWWSRIGEYAVQDQNMRSPVKLKYYLKQ